MWELIFSGASLGFAAGTIPGTLHSFLMNQTLRYGWRRSIFIPFSPLLTDIPIILLTLGLLGQLPAEVLSAIQVLGGAYALHLAREAWLKLRQPNPLSMEEAPSSQRKTLWQAMMVNWLNPAPYLFWGTVSAPLLLRGLEESLLVGGFYLLAFYGVFIGLMLGFLLLFHQARRFDTRIVSGLLWMSIVMLLVLGLLLMGQGLVALAS